MIQIGGDKMIFAVKDTKCYEVKDVFAMAIALKKEDGVKTYAWQVKESIEKHSRLRGWKIIES